MSNGKLANRSTTSEIRVLQSSYCQTQISSEKRSSSQIQTQSTKPVFCKFLYSKGKLIHSKLVISKPFRKVQTSNLKRETNFSASEILELQEFFRNKKSLSFQKTKFSDLRSLRSKLCESRVLHLKRTNSKTRNTNIGESFFVAMKSTRANRVFRIFEEANEIFDDQDGQRVDEGFFVTDNDIDTDEEQQTKAVRTNVDSYVFGFEKFTRERDESRKRNRTITPHLKRFKK